MLPLEKYNKSIDEQIQGNTCQEIPGKYHLQGKCQTSNFFKINQILLDLKILLHVESQKAHNFELHQGKISRLSSQHKKVRTRKFNCDGTF